MPSAREEQIKKFKEEKKPDKFMGVDKMLDISVREEMKKKKKEKEEPKIK